MKVRLTLTNKGQTISRHVREVADITSFAAACTEVRNEFEGRAVERTTSGGELTDRVNERAPDQLDGAPPSFARE